MPPVGKNFIPDVFDLFSDDGLLKYILDGGNEDL
jgi:hypothetical protein